MSDFFRFPHTPHLKWLAAGAPRDDKVLSMDEAETLLDDNILIEEKIDGANIGLSLASDGSLRVQNRGQYLFEPFTGQFTRLSAWLIEHGGLLQKMGKNLILFGEWCAARHSLDYTSLPDWFLLFDVYDKDEGRFWSCLRRNQLAIEMKVSAVPLMASGHFGLPDLELLLKETCSHCRQGAPEGLIIRRDSERWNEARAKLVSADFTQNIGGHWRNRNIEWNRKQGDPRVT